MYTPLDHHGKAGWHGRASRKITKNCALCIHPYSKNVAKATVCQDIQRPAMAVLRVKKHVRARHLELP